MPLLKVLGKNRKALISMTSELYLFIIWKNAESQKQRIIHDISRKFEIRDIYEIRWSEERFSENMSRFYGQKLPPGSSKEMHCGVGPFIVVVVSDNSPVYEFRYTTGGQMSVNANIFDAKFLYRQWTGGGHKIHATNMPRETDHDLTLILGVNIIDYLREWKRKKWDGETRIIERDLTGAGGWESIARLFYALNASIDYVVLRNFECLPKAYNMEGHGDIDLLVSNYKEARWITNAKSVFKEPNRVYNHIRIDGKNVPFDFRFVGDNYYDERWERKILKDRVLESNCFYRPNDKDYFYSLLYHAMVHKFKISSDYIEKLTVLAEIANIENFNPTMFSDTYALKDFLYSYMKSKNFKYVKPNDLSVYYKELRSCPLPFIRPTESVISTKLLTEKDGTEYWSRVYDGGNVIYKQASLDLAEREQYFLLQLSSDYFPRVLEAISHGVYSLIVLEKIQGLSLDEAKVEISDSLSILHRFFQHCLDLLAELNAKGIAHRDIRKENIFVRDNKPVLIDFGWAVSDAQPYFTPSMLGGNGKPPDGSFCDVYSMGKIFEQINKHRCPEFDLVVELMTEPEGTLRETDLQTLKILFACVASSIGCHIEEEQLRAKVTETSGQSGTSNVVYAHTILQLLQQISKRNQRLKENIDDAWMERVHTAIEEIVALIPPEDKFILVDEDQWGTDDVVAGRRRILFLERDGMYWGLPPDDDIAIRELERLRESGAKFIVFGWPTFWWFDYYRGLHSHLRSVYSCVLKNDHIVVFDLRVATGNQSKPRTFV